MILDTHLKSITAVLSGAVSANQPIINASWEDFAGSGREIVTARGSKSTTMVDVTAVTAVPAPDSIAPNTGAASNSRKVILFSLYNKDTAAVTVTINVVTNAVASPIGVFTLSAGETLQYTPGQGFRVTTTSGAIKNTQTAGSANQLKVLIPIATGLLSTLVNTTTYRVALPFGFTVLSARFVADVPATTTSKLATLTLSTTAGAVTGGVMALTSANMTPTGAAVAATAISGANATGTAGQEVIITVSAVTAFVEGSGHVEVTVSNNS